MVIKWLLIGILIGWLTQDPYLGPIKKQYGTLKKKILQDIGFGDNMIKWFMQVLGVMKDTMLHSL